jgi:hypothetical protein
MMNAKVTFEQNRDLEFKKTLYRRVSEYFAENKISRNHTPHMVIKTIAMLGMYILPFVMILLLPMPLWVVMVLYFVMGLGMAGIGMAVMHDSKLSDHFQDRESGRTTVPSGSRTTTPHTAGVHTEQFICLPLVIIFFSRLFPVARVFMGFAGYFLLNGFGLLAPGMGWAQAGAVSEF